MKFRNRYTNYIKSNCASRADEIRGLAFWRNNLFAGAVIYLLPFSLIALVPGVYMSIISHKYVLAIADVAAATSMMVIAFIPGISIHFRKIIFIGCLYMLSCVLLYYLGQFGPGLIYLQASCIFCILIFPAKYAWWPAILNTFICLMFGLAIPFNYLPWLYSTQNATGAWITVSSNLVFLSFLSTILIPRLFNGLQETILNEKQLQKQLNQKQQSLEQAMEMLEQKNNELEQFAFIASHDLQEPLRMITGFLGQLEKKYKPIIDDKGKQYIHFIVDGARRMQQLILDLLEFSLAGRIEESPEDVDLNELVNEAQILFRTQIEEKKAVIQVGKLPVILTHVSPLRQVFQNLIGNALKYAKEGVPAEISISVQECETHWQLMITDNGIGILKEYFDRIFIIFQRLHSKEEYEGTGVGLAICKKIIENLGGKIKVESEEGKGSTFHFTLLKKL